jgi:hypothetical protein
MTVSSLASRRRGSDLSLDDSSDIVRMSGAHIFMLTLDHDATFILRARVPHQNPP